MIKSGRDTKTKRVAEKRQSKDRLRHTIWARKRETASSASSHQSDRFMSDSSQRPSERPRPCRRTPSALLHHESFMRGKITRRGAKWLDGRKKERKNPSPLRQKASVVPKSTLICDLADPRLEEACGKEKKMSQVVLFTFAI